MKRASVVTVCVMTFLSALSGCSKSNTDLCEISGTLTFKGKPIPQVYLRFEPTEMGNKSTSMAVTDERGRFEMFIGSTPGVFRGKVKIICDDPLAAMGSKSPIPADIEPAYRELCDKYGNGKSTYELTIDKPDSNLQLRLE